MAQNFTLTFTDGVAPETDIEYGTYDIEIGTITGYATATIDPSTLIVNAITNPEIPIKLTADGSASVTITDSSGNPVTSGIDFARVVAFEDSIAYPAESGVIDTTGSATGLYKINYLPYVDTTGMNVYFKVSASGYDNAELTIPMNQKDVTGLTLTLKNALPVNATLQDAKFTGFPLSGTVTGTVQ